MPPKIRPKACHVCGRRAQDGHRISFRALCRDCAIASAEKAMEEMRNKSGDTYQRWRDARLKAARKVLDELDG